MGNLSSRHRVYRSLAVALTASSVGVSLGMAGCGGGGGSTSLPFPTPTPVSTATPTPNPTPTPTPTPPPPVNSNVRLAINWPERTRTTVTSPGSALSAVISVSNGNVNDNGFSPVTFPPINRDSNPAAYTQAYVSPTAVRVGQTTVLTVRFYTEPNGAGTLVGEASLPVTLDNNGSSGATLDVVGTVASTIVIPNQSLIVGASGGFAFFALDANGNAVALSPGSERWSVESGGDKLSLTPAGVGTGLGYGASTIAVTVDGKKSAPVAVAVTVGGARVTAGQTLGVTETKKLTFVGLNANGGEIPVPAEVGQWSLASGEQPLNLAADGTAFGKGIGTGKVTVTIDGRTSEVADVTITQGPTVAENGITFNEQLLGTGASPTVGQSISVRYIGQLPNGTVFDRNDAPGAPLLTFTLGSGQVIPGFDRAFYSLKPGGQRVVQIPAALAYGPNPPPGSGIPPNSDLVFIVQLVGVN